MNWAVILLDGPLRNQTLSGIQFDKHGNPTEQQVYVCHDYVDGFNWAKQQGYSHGLFVKNGTMFTDWPEWKKLIDNYPHAGLIGHLIWKPGTKVFLHDQCWFMSLEKFVVEDFTVKQVSHPEPIRSDQNLHDDYTPLWIKPNNDASMSYDVSEFGQGLIAKQLQNNRAVVNWNNSARDLKFFLYNGILDTSRFQEYKDIAENQLWIFNNELVEQVGLSNLVAPGSGLYWMSNILDDRTSTVQIVDISKIQIKFCQHLWNTWNGVDYGDLVWQFIADNNLKHYQLDNPRLTPMEKLQLKKRSNFVAYVNDKFTSHFGQNFSSRWQQVQKSKTVNFHNANLIDWVLNNDIEKYDHIWCSNILNYKWTLLHTTVEQCNAFHQKIK